MGGLQSRIEGTSDEVAHNVVRRLEAGEASADAGLDAVDLVAAIARLGLGGEGSEGPSLVQASPTYPRLKQAVADELLARLFPRSARADRLALAAGLLQILDFWDASHTAAQEADDLGEHATAAYWHMIAHRREPDAGNAHYWARRVGRHPIFESLAKAARPLLEAHGDQPLADRLTPGGAWSPTAHIDLATRTRPDTAALARRLQRLEMIFLLEASLLAAGSR
jgi:hypothetical protein